MSQYVRPGGGYMQSHWDGCECEACEAIYANHNSMRVCPCGGCKTRRAVKTGRKIKVATVNFCERCNTLGKSLVMGIVSQRDYPGSDGGTDAEICPGCVADFHDFMEGKPVEGKPFTRPQSYTERYTARGEDPTADLSDDELARAYLRRVAGEDAVKALATRPQDDEPLPDL